MSDLDRARAAAVAAAQVIPRAYAVALGSIERDRSEAVARHTSAAKAAERRARQAGAIARTRSANHAIATASQAVDRAGELLAANGTGILAAAAELRIGTLRWQSDQLDVHGTFEVPAVVPFLGAGNVIVHGSGPAVLRHLRSFLSSAVTATAPGQLDLAAYDPRLTGLMAPFSPLKAEHSLVTASSTAELDELLTRLAADVGRVRDEMRGFVGDLVAYRSSIGEPIERLQIVVLTDYPFDVRPDQHRQVVDLLRVGPAAGISFLVGFDPAQRAECDLDASEVLAHGEVLDISPATVSWRRHPLPQVEVPDVADTLDAHVDRWVREAAVSRGAPVTFDELHQGTDWQHSSAEGITFTLGKRSARPHEIRLGDRDLQKHNVLVTGAVGQGKSNLLMAMVHSLAHRYDPDELDLYLLDFKEGVTLYPLAPTPTSPSFLPHARLIGLESDVPFGLAVLRHLQTEFARRAKLVKPHGDDIGKYRAGSGRPMARIVVVIDEFQVLFEGSDKLADEAVAALSNLSRKGRAYGIHLVLASQTLSGISALMGKEDGIFSQFPIRIGLKNSLSESYTTFQQGNDAAARLRVRGQAIVNVEYGDPVANATVTIAHADEAQLRVHRERWWRASAARGRQAPRVFDGGAAVRPDLLDSPEFAIVEERVNGTAVLGQCVDVAGSPATVPFPAVPGRNLAVLGAGATADGCGGHQDGHDNGVGVLQGAALALARQHAGAAEFVFIDLLDRASVERNRMPAWLAQMQALRAEVRTIGPRELNGWLSEIEMQLVEVRSTPLYVLGFALDRAVALEVPDAFANRPSEKLQRLLQIGPALRIHTLGWWTSVPTFRRHVGFGGEGNFDAMLLLRVDNGTAKELLGPFATWEVLDNRALLVDRAELAAPVTIVPFSPVAAGGGA